MSLLPSRWTYLLLELNAARDRGAELPFDEVEKQVEGGSVLDYVEEKLGDLIDLSLLDAENRREMNAWMQDLFAAIGRHNLRRKFGVEKTGMSFVTALAIEAVQQARRPA